MSEDNDLGKPIMDLIENIAGRKLCKGSVLEELEITRTYFDELILSESDYWLFIYKDDNIKVLTREFVFDLDNKMSSILMIENMDIFVNIFEGSPMNKGKDVEDEINKVLDSLSRLDQFEKATELKTIWGEFKKSRIDGN